MVIAARFESICPNCNLRIMAGSSVNWSRGVKATHVTCPQQTSAESLVDAAMRTENLVGATELLTAIVNGDAEGNAVLAQVALDIIEDKLFAEYEARQLSQVISETPPEQRWDVVPNTPTLLKGIYRVSLTGAERRYGIDHVNLSLVPNEKYQNIKVSEWQGESLGRLSRDGRFSFWPSYEDRTSPRTQALLAALDIVRGSADPIAFAKAYAVESSTCWRCGADLVDEKSRERLLGPECFKLVGKAS
jgi:hypothetical protein